MFGEKLQNMVESVKGGQAAVVIDLDGIPLDSYVLDDTDIETVGMEFSVLLKEVMNATLQLEAGKTNEMSVKADSFCTILRVINDEYFLAMSVASNGNLGKARYLLRINAPEIAAEL